MSNYIRSMVTSRDGLVKIFPLGFSLIEVLAALTVFAVFFLFVSQLASFFEQQSKLTLTKSRMQKIVSQAKMYYRTHERLPLPDNRHVPTKKGMFRLGPKFRFDAWGRSFQYWTFRNDNENGRPGEILIDNQEPYWEEGAWPDDNEKAMAEVPKGTRTLLRAVEYNQQRVAGIVISSGPNQHWDYKRIEGYPTFFSGAEKCDDIFMLIDLTSEAMSIAFSELKILNTKVKALNDRYLGVDNDRDDQFDEGSCKKIPRCAHTVPYRGPKIVAVCPGKGRYAASLPPKTDSDITCISKTLDYMKGNYCGFPFSECVRGYKYPEIEEIPQTYRRETDTETGEVRLVDCPTQSFQKATYARIPFDQNNPFQASQTDCNWGLVDSRIGRDSGYEPDRIDNDQARAFLFCVFNLSPENIVDPWLNGYEWGCGGSDCQQTYPPDDPHYHRFFSCGPDGRPADPGAPEDPNDDIIF